MIGILSNDPNLASSKPSVLSSMYNKECMICPNGKDGHCLSTDTDYFDPLATFPACNFHHIMRIALFIWKKFKASCITLMIGIKKTIAMSALGFTPNMQQLIGFPGNPSYVPGLFTSYSDEMSFWERLDNFKFTIELHYRLLSWERQLHALANKVSPGFPNLQDLIKVHWK
ncbi:hypothetical protein KIN20_020840 [Parelaphostrongylus tenuis]|uniref:Uncharacterized protein n=1 Tax=Parelaphostrongylus tenuis TaxID=148309 RepID=A0AAD5MN21_PARTN|nr:hypothetical protein KIN20_020840 [Parelaphostrongylus tenuis]